MSKKQCMLCKHFNNSKQINVKYNCKISVKYDDKIIIELSIMGFTCPWYEKINLNSQNKSI